MNIKVFQNRKVSKDYFDNEGTQNENYSTTLSFEVPLGYEDFSKRIVFITEDGNFWDYIKDNEYVIKNNITKYENVEAYLWLTKDNQDFRSETFELNFYENQNPDDMTPSEEQLDGYNTLIAELELKVEEVDTLKEETLEALEKLKEQQIDYENRFKEINKMLKELKDTNEYQSEIIDQFKNEFDEKEFKGANAYLPDSAELPLKLQPQGNIEQEVIEAVEGITVIDTNMNLTDVDTTKESKLSPNGGIEQDTREGYNKIKVLEKTGTKNGIDYVASNGTVTVNGTATKDTYLYEMFEFEDYEAGDYFVSGCPSGGDTTKYNFGVDGISGSSDFGTGKQISVSEAVSKRAVIIVRNGATVSNLVFEPMVTSGTTQKEFEQYGSMPSLAFPSEVKGVGGHYDTVVSNKNIWKPTLVSNGTAILQTRCKVELNEDEYTFTATGADMYFGNVVATGMPYINIAGTLYEVKDKKTIVINQTNAEFTTNYITYFDENKISVGYGRITNGVPITLADNVKYVCFRTGKFDSVAGTVYKTKIQVEYDTATEYTPHQEQLLPIDIPFNMYSGKPYKENGKWFRPIKSVKLPFNTDIFKDPKIIASYVKDHLVGFVIAIRAGANNFAKASNVYSNKFKNKLLLGSGVSSEENVRHNRGIATSPDNTWQLVITIEKTELEKDNIDMTSAEAIFNWLIAQDFYIVLEELATPTVEEITDTTLISQLEALQNAELYDGVTNINSYRSSEDVAEMPLEAHYNFITPAPSIDRPSEVLEVGSDEEINIARLEAEGKYRGYETGNFINVANYNSYIAEVKPNTQYSFRRIGTQGVSNVAYFDKDMKYLSGQATSTNIITPNNCRFFTVAVHKDNQDFMIYEGTIERLFTPPGYCRYETVVGNKNIYNANIGVEKGYLNGADGTVITGSGWKVSDYIKIPDNVDVITLLNGWGKGEVHCFYDKNKKLVDAIGINSSFINTKKIIKDNCKYVRFTVSDIYKEDFMIAFGDTDTFIEHQEQTFPIDLPIGVKMYNDEFFYKDGGDWYFDKKWEKVNLVDLVIINVVDLGSFTRISLLGAYDSKGGAYKAYSNYSKHLQSYSKQVEHFYAENDSKIYLFINNNDLISIDTAGAEDFITNHSDMYFVYQLANPIPTKITDPILIQELEDISRAFSYYPVTNVNSYKPTVNVADLILNGKYYVSNKSKFKTLEERVSALENETVNE